MSDETPPPKVFISYSHAPAENAERVRSIAQRLAADGVDVEMDIWAMREGHDVNAFMERMATDGTVMKVLIFSNRSYAEKADARNRGVGVEAQILSAEIYGKVKQEKFIPIVCEFDDAGQGCLPTFLKGRLYIDFSSAEAEATNYERLVRLIFDKPEHTKPAIGKPPAFITAESIPPNPLSAKLRSYRDALIGGRSNTRFLLEDFLDRFVAALGANRIRDNGKEPFDEVLIRSLAALKPFRDDFLDLCDIWVRSADAPLFVPKVVQVLEQVRALGEWPDDAQSWQDSYGENFHFLAHELFLSVLAILLRHGEFRLLTELLSTRFVLPASEKPRDEKSGFFMLFYQYSEVLKERNQRLGQRLLNPEAALLKERATTAAAPFVWMQQADLLCFVRCVLVHPDEWPWYPHTLVYARRQYGGFETFQRAESRAFYDRLAPVWGGLKPDAFRTRFAEVMQQSKAGNWNFDHVRPNWAAWLNLEKLGTVA